VGGMGNLKNRTKLFIAQGFHGCHFPMDAVGAEMDAVSRFMER
jgi:hypothetical protein